MYQQYFAIEKELKYNGFKGDRKDLVYDFTDGKKDGLSQLTPTEYREFIKSLNSRLNNSYGRSERKDKMRKKIIAIAVHQMGYSMERLQAWCVAYGKFHKELNEHTYKELVELVSQVENLYAAYQKDLNK